MGDCILARRGGGVDLTGSNTTPSDVLAGKKFFSEGSDEIQSGNIPVIGDNWQMATPIGAGSGYLLYNPPKGYYYGGGDCRVGSYEPDLIPANVLPGKTICGMAGSAKVGMEYYYADFDANSLPLSSSFSRYNAVTKTTQNVTLPYVDLLPYKLSDTDIAVCTLSLQEGMFRGVSNAYGIEWHIVDTVSGSNQHRFYRITGTPSIWSATSRKIPLPEGAEQAMLSVLVFKQGQLFPY